MKKRLYKVNDTIGVFTIIEESKKIKNRYQYKVYCNEYNRFGFLSSNQIRTNKNGKRFPYIELTKCKSPEHFLSQFKPWKDNGRLRVRFNKSSIQYSRLVWYAHYGLFPINNIDHIDGNPLNNNLSNLRDVLQAHNVMNTEGTKYTGIHFEKDTQKYLAKYGKKNLGRFLSKDEALKARLDYMKYKNIRQYNNRKNCSHATT